MSIQEFRGNYYFLSNFFHAPVTYQGVTYQNNESAFQSMKLLDPEKRKEFSSLAPSAAKRKGRQVQLRRDWETVKETIMYEICKAKFEQNLHLKQKLMATGTQVLIEGNNWNDREWGVCNGHGENKLGKILMKIRDDLLARSEDSV